MIKFDSLQRIGCPVAYFKGAEAMESETWREAAFDFAASQSERQFGSRASTDSPTTYESYLLSEGPACKNSPYPCILAALLSYQEPWSPPEDLEETIGVYFYYLPDR
jgi:hypothetical protein